MGDLTNKTFLNALKRFADRWSLITDIYSDNATNFVGANSQLSELRKLLVSQEHKINIQGFFYLQLV